MVVPAHNEHRAIEADVLFRRQHLLLCEMHLLPSFSCEENGCHAPASGFVGKHQCAQMERVLGTNVLTL